MFGINIDDTTTTNDTNLPALNIGDPEIGTSIWVDTDRFFFIGRFRGRSKDGEFWILDKVSMVVQMGVVTDIAQKGTAALHEVYPFATAFYAVRYSSITGWREFPHELPDKPITRA
jgi:hypothetical protein